MTIALSVVGDAKSDEVKILACARLLDYKGEGFIDMSVLGSHGHEVEGVMMVLTPKQSEDMIFKIPFLIFVKALNEVRSKNVRASYPNFNIKVPAELVICKGADSDKEQKKSQITLELRTTEPAPKSYRVSASDFLMSHTMEILQTAVRE